MTNMLTKFKNILMALTGLTVLLSPALVPVVASAQANISGGVCTGSNLSLSGTPDSSCASDPTGSNNTLSDLLTKIINIFSVVVGVIAVIMIIVGGLRYIISGGDSGGISGAKNTIIYALVGLIIVALAQVIVHFVLSRVGNT